MFRPASTYDIAATADTATTAINPNFDDTDGYDDDIQGGVDDYNDDMADVDDHNDDMADVDDHNDDMADVDDHNDDMADVAAKAEDDDKENVSRICMKALNIVYCHLLIAKLYALNKKDCILLNMDQIISP